MIQSNLPATLHAVQGNTHLLLNNERAVWRVESGSLALFATRIDPQTQIQGDRRYLFTVEAGEIVWGMPPLTDLQHSANHRSVVAIALEETMLEAIAPNSTLNDLIDGWILRWDEWLDQQQGIQHEEAIEEILTPVPAARYLSLLTQQALQSPQQVVQWVKIQQGQVQWMGMKGLTLDSNSPPFPLTPHTRITAELPTEVQFLTLADGLDPDLLMSSLLQFHQFLNQLSGQLEQHQRQAEFDRFLDRERFEPANPVQRHERSGIAAATRPLGTAAGRIAAVGGGWGSCPSPGHSPPSACRLRKPEPAQRSVGGDRP